MKTIALRFGEHFAPECGTIAAHQEIIDSEGYAWYGKMGTPISDKVAKIVLANEKPRILLIRSGKPERYWASILEITRDVPDKRFIPEYYRNECEKFKTWFKITEFSIAEKKVLSKYVVSSSLTPLGSVSKHSMSPYFIIEGE